MHWTRVSLLCLCATVCALSRSASAQVTDATSGVVQLDDFSGSMSLSNDGGTYFLFDRMNGDGVGYSNSYTRVGLRAKLLDLGESHFFTELNGLITDQSRFGVNLGGGFRTLYDGGIFGTHAWYDQYETVNGNSYSQASIGAEYLHRWLDLRANGYMPFGDRENFVRTLSPGTAPVFFGNTFGTIGVGQFERSLAGFDIEGGIPLPIVNWLRIYGGTYFLTAKGDDTWGVRSRVEARVGQGASVNFMVSNDERFGTNLNLQVQMMLGRGRLPTVFNPDMSGWARRYDPVRRASTVQVALDKAPINVPLINTETGRIFDITWVDNTSDAPGDGTFEHPFVDLPNSAPTSDHVLVRTGVGPTTGNIALVDNQHLWGEGHIYTLHTDRLGAVTIPDQYFRQTGPRPTLQPANINLPIVTLANNDEVINFNMNGGAVDIFGSNIRNFRIEDVHGSATDGLVINNASGLGVLRHSEFTASGAGTAAFISNTGGSRLDLIIDDLMTHGGTGGLHVYSQQSLVQADIQHYLGDHHTGTALTLNEFQGFLFANVTDAHIDNTGGLSGLGIELRAVNGGRLGVNMQDVSAEGNNDLLVVNANTATVNLNVNQADFSFSTLGTGVSINAANSLGTFNFNNLTARGNGVDGFRMAGSSGSQLSAQIINSDLSGNFDDNIDVTAVSGADVSLFVDPTNASNSMTGNAFEFFVDGAGSTLAARFLNVDLSNAGQNAIDGIITNGGGVRLDLTNVQANRADLNGLNLLMSNNARFQGVARTSTFANSGVGNNGIGINIFEELNSAAYLDLNGAPVNNNGARGLNFDVRSGSALTVLSNGGNFSNNQLANISGSVTGAGSAASLQFNNVIANNLADESGVNLAASGGARLDVNWTGANSSIANTNANGVRLVGNNPGTVINFRFSGGVIHNNFFDGVDAVMTGGAGSQLNVTLDNANVFANVDNGLDYALSGAGARGRLQLNGTQLHNNGQDGLEFDVTSGAVLTGLGAASDFSNNGERGIHGTVDGSGSIATINFGAATANSNDLEGALLTTSNDGLLSVVLNNAEFTDNGRENLRANVLSGGDLVLRAVGGDFSAGGTSGLFDNVRVDTTGAGSTATLVLDSDNFDGATQNGLLLFAANQGSVFAELRSGAGTLTSSNNAASGLRILGNNADQLIVFGNGPNVFSGNALDNVDIDVNTANVAAFRLTGTMDGSVAGDGVNINLNNVAAGAIGVIGPGSVSDNAGDGIEIDVANSTLMNITYGAQTVHGLEIRDMTFSGNGGDNINVHLDNTDLNGSGEISGNTITGGANGIIVQSVNGGDTTLNIHDNTVETIDHLGIAFLADSGTHNLTIANNTVIGSGDHNVFVDLSGTAIASQLHIDNNTIDGNGVPGSIVAQTGAAFLGSSFSAFLSGEPPDTMGAVGPNHIMELLNDRFAVYNKTTGALIMSSSDETFWTNAGANLGTSDVFDHRLIYDTIHNRWIASAITRDVGNSILVAVSVTSDPTGPWRSVQFQGDLNGALFNDFDMLAVDSDAVIITTNNFDANNVYQDESIFSIPLVDLTTGVPSIARLTRIANVPDTTIGFTPQPVVNMGPTNTNGLLISADYFNAPNGQLILTQLNGVNNAAATLGTSTTVTGVPAFTFAPNATQPGGVPAASGGDRMSGNAVEVNGNIWAVTGVQGTTGKAAVRWFEIDPTTNAIIQTGLIDDPNLDYFYPSIAVNPAGQVVIGFSGSSNTQFISSYYAFGVTAGGTTTFANPTLTRNGTGTYQGSRWGDYSATVVDPSNPNRFWSFQEVATGAFSYATTFAAVDVITIAPIAGNTAGDGIRVNVSDNAAIVNGTINGNISSSNGEHGVHVDVADAAQVVSLHIDRDTADDNGAGGILYNSTAGTALGTLSIDGRDPVNGNSSIAGSGGNGIEVNLDTVAGNPDVLIAGYNISQSAGLGITLTGRNTSLEDVAILNNNISDSTGGDGIRVDLTNPGGSATLRSLVVSGNSVANSAGTGLNISLDALNTTVLRPSVDMAANTITDNLGLGVSVSVLDMSVNNVLLRNSTITGNSGGDGVFFNFQNLAPRAANRIEVTGSTSSNNGGNGVSAVLNNVTVGGDFSLDSSIVTNNIAGGLAYLATNSTNVLINVSDSNISSNSSGDGVLLSLLNSGANTVNISGSGINGNGGNGVNIDADNSPIGALNIVDNSGGTAVNIGLGFLIDGNTFPFAGVPAWSIVNSSGPGILLTGFNFDVAPSGHLYNTVSGGSFPFTPELNSDVTTGLTSVNGTAVPPYPANLVPDFSTILNLAFSDFQPGETFSWNIDADITPGGDETVLGNDLIGSTITVNFSGGLFLSGALVAVPGNPDAAQFVATGGNNVAGGISGNTGDGVRLNLTNGSDIAAMTVDNNIIDANTLHGIEFLIDDSTLPGPGAPILISNNTITNHANGDGIRILNPNTNGTPIGIDFDGNTISDNTGGNGINGRFIAASGGLTTNITGNTINGNAQNGINLLVTDNDELNINDFSGNTINGNVAGMGLHIDARQNSHVTFHAGASAATFGQNSINGNATAGIGIRLRNSSQADIDIINTSVTNTRTGSDPIFAGEGLRVQAEDNAAINTFRIGNGAVGTFDSNFSNNAGSGVHLDLSILSRLIDPLFQTSTFNGNGADGIHIFRRNNALLDNIQIVNNRFNGNTSNGVDLHFQGGNVNNQTLGLLIIDAEVANNTSAGNGRSGVLMDLDADVNLQANIHDNTITNNGRDGIEEAGHFDAILTGTFSDNFITGSGRDGVNITLTERAQTFATIEDSEISGSTRDGIRVQTGNTLLLGGVPFASILVQNNTPINASDTRGIHDNGGTGINLIASSVSTQVVEIDNNRIFENGIDGIAMTVSDFAVIDASSFGVNNNLIQQNGQHGVNLNTSGNSQLGVRLTDNSIFRNTRRGVSLVNTGNADTALTITGTNNPIPSQGTAANSRIEQNGEVGIFVENNAGVLNTDNDILLDVNNTSIVGNGANPAVASDDRNGLWIRVGTSSFGSVNANVDRNFFSGNGNVDVVTESFTATPDPGVASQYTNPGAVQADPLARLGFRLTNNVGDEIDVTRFGATYGNADQFKSPLAFFDSASRLRNAQRFTANVLVVNNDTVQAQDVPAVGDPAPAANAVRGTVFAGFLPNQTYVGLGIDIPRAAGAGNATHDITAYSLANDLITFAPGLAGPPAPGTAFDIEANGISGIGPSTFRSAFSSVTLGGNTWTTVITDFNSQVFLVDGPGGNPDDDVFLQTFTWAFPFPNANPFPDNTLPFYP